MEITKMSCGRLTMTRAMTVLTLFIFVRNSDTQQRVFSNNFGRQVFQDPNNPRLRFTLVPTFAGPFPVFQQPSDEREEGPGHPQQFSSSNEGFHSSEDPRNHQGHFMSGPPVFIPREQNDPPRHMFNAPPGPGFRPGNPNGPPPPRGPIMNQHPPQQNIRFFERPQPSSGENFGPPSTSTTPRFRFVTSGPHNNNINGGGTFNNHVTFTNPQNGNQQQQQQPRPPPNQSNGGSPPMMQFFNPFLSAPQPLFPFHQQSGQSSAPRFAPRPQMTTRPVSNFVNLNGGVNQLTSAHIESTTSPTIFPTPFQLQAINQGPQQPPQRFQPPNSVNNGGLSGEFQNRPQQQQQHHQQQNFVNNGPERLQLHPSPFSQQQLQQPAPSFQNLQPRPENQFQQSHSNQPTNRPQFNSQEPPTSGEFRPPPPRTEPPPQRAPPTPLSSAFPVGPQSFNSGETIGFLQQPIVNNPFGFSSQEVGNNHHRPPPAVATSSENNFNPSLVNGNRPQSPGSNFPSAAAFPRAPISFFRQGFVDFTPPTTPILFFANQDIGNSPPPSGNAVQQSTDSNRNQPTKGGGTVNESSNQRPGDPFRQVNPVTVAPPFFHPQQPETNQFPVSAETPQNLEGGANFPSSGFSSEQAPPSSQQQSQEFSTETSIEQAGLDQILTELPRLVDRPTSNSQETPPTVTGQHFPTEPTTELATEPPPPPTTTATTTHKPEVTSFATTERAQPATRQPQRLRVRKLRPRIQSPSAAAILDNLQKPLPGRENQPQRPQSTTHDRTEGATGSRITSTSSPPTTKNGRRTSRGRRPTRFRRPPSTEANLQDISGPETPAVSPITKSSPSRSTNNAFSSVASDPISTSASSPPVVGSDAKFCNPDSCRLPNCFCGGNKQIPGDLKPSEIPQMILLTFDDSVNDINYQFYSSLLNEGRVNPNECPISATFYVSHEWTDYAKIQTLYALGHEIASHSISHSDGASFSQDRWLKDIYGQKRILSALGGVKLEDIKGMRAPFLQGGGNKQFAMLHETNFTYDSSIPAHVSSPPIWPYTLDHRMPHECGIPPCPTKSYPGVWEVPMVMWEDLKGGRCAMADACQNPADARGVYDMLVKNFKRHYTTNRAPFGMFYHYAWFTHPHQREGFLAFVDAVLKLPDVYFVTNSQMIEWMRDPVPASQLSSYRKWQCGNPDAKVCTKPRKCSYRFRSDERQFPSCNACPEKYPWLESYDSLHVTM